MSSLRDIGYAGKLLRVNLTTGQTRPQEIDEATARKWVGGVGLASKILFDEVPVRVGWSDPENLLIWTTGPLAGTSVAGAATFNVTTKGPMTNLAVSTQANGFFGAYLKFAGYDGLVFQGRAPKLSYLVINKDGQVEIKDAAHLAGLDMSEVEKILRQDLGVKGHEVSIFGIGPAGENLVRYACITGDTGHVASKGGVGAVMGAKNLKAVAVFQGKRGFGVFDEELLGQRAKELVEFAKGFGTVFQWGTGGGFSGLYSMGALPVRNYTTNIYPEHEQMSGRYLRTHFEVKAMPCYRCAIAHVKEVTVTEGPYKGFVGEEPEYEQLAAWGPQIGNTDLGATVVLTDLVDKLGMDCNEASWIVGWAMECFEKGVFTAKETEGLDLTWGNVEATRELLVRISKRQGFLGNLLAEGCMRAANLLGGQAANWAIYGGKGASPRGHDHRGNTRWYELLDTCFTNTSTLEATWGGIHPALVDMTPPKDNFSPEEVSTFNAQYSGYRLFDDCVGTCRLASPAPKLVLACFNAATGWNWTIEDAKNLGLRIANLLRVYSIKHGVKPEDEKPSPRYGSAPVDGPAKGISIMEKWDFIRQNYYRHMGWDPDTGKPKPETLAKYGLAELAQEL